MLTIQLTEAPPWLTVRLSGEFDRWTAAALQLPPQALRAATTVELDLTDLRSCDASGLAALDRLCGDLVAGGRQVRVVGLDPTFCKQARVMVFLHGRLPDRPALRSGIDVRAAGRRRSDA